MSLSNELRGTDSFIWCTKHAIGVGATSTVFIGRFKKTGDQVAIKVFNNAAYARPRDLQQRELEFVRNLKHKNIVEVFGIEEDHVTKQPVIIMELCRGGSVYQFLEEPENIYGLTEQEFLTALKHILGGMKYLRRSGVVHRDIKPGNIMRVKGEDGSHTYKLADFGAARQVEHEEESLQSLCGTEEYLRADLYEIAVLRFGGKANYTRNVDLWSLGVTLYQIATGQLPFRPYGGRRNKETMHYLITRKKSGVISGVQHDSPTGRIEWSNELPTNCHLSKGLKPHIEYIVGRLLEGNHDKIWNFDELFEFTDNLTKMKRVDVFDTQTTELLSVYVQPTVNSDELSRKIKEQSNIEPNHQVLCWKDDVFNIEEVRGSLPRTRADSPLILYSNEDSRIHQTIIRQTPTPPSVTSAYNLENDALICKLVLATLFFVLRVASQVMTSQNHIITAVNTLRKVFRDKIRSALYKNSRLQQLQTEFEIKLSMLSHRIQFCTTSMLTNNINKTVHNTSIEETKDNLHTISIKYRQDLQPEVTELNDKLKLLAKEDFTHNFEDLICNEDDRCIERFEVIVEDVREIYDQFKKDKREKKLKYNEEQIHKMDKQKLRSKCIQGVSLFRDQCEPKMKTLHSNFSRWYRNINSKLKSLERLESDMDKFSMQFNDLINSLDKVEDNLQNVITSTSTAVRLSFRAMTEKLKVSDNQIQTLNKKLNAAELKVSKLEAENKQAAESTRGIRVPRYIKEQLLFMGNKLGETKQDISKSSRILEEMRMQRELQCK